MLTPRFAYVFKLLTSRWGTESEREVEGGGHDSGKGG